MSEIKEFSPLASQLKPLADKMKEVQEPTPVDKIENIIAPQEQKIEEPKPDKVEPEKVEEPAPPKEEKEEPSGAFQFGDFKETKTEEKPDLLKSLGSALKIEASDEQEFVSKVSEAFKQLDELKSKPVEGLPPQLQEAVEAAQKGADWQTLMGLTDYSRVDPLDLFDREYERINGHRFKNEKGEIDREAMWAAIDSTPEPDRAVIGENLKARLMESQRTQKAQYLQEAERKKSEFNSKLAEKSRELSQLFPKDTYQVELTPAHSEYFFKGISSRELIKKHLGNIDERTLQSLDATKLLRTIAAAEMARELTENAYKEGGKAKQREVLKTSQNVQLSTPAIPARPEIDGDKPTTAQSRMEKFVSSLNATGRL